MPRILEKTVYQFGELSDRAKERARDWYRQHAFDYNWWDSVYEDVEIIADIFGVTLARKAVPLMGGKTRYDPAIYFSGFSSQGDGARFEGSYSYPAPRYFDKSAKLVGDRRKGKSPAKLIRDHCGGDSEATKRIYEIADALQDLQRRHFYQLTADIKLGRHGNYEHEHNTEITVGRMTEQGEEREITAETEEAVKQELRRFMRWIYRQLEADHDGLNSDEAIEEAITANEYEFDENGRRAT